MSKHDYSFIYKLYLRYYRSNKGVIIFAVSSIYIRQTARLVCSRYHDDTIVVISNEIDSDSLMTMSVVIKSEIPEAEAVVYSGSTCAEKVALDLSTTIISACENDCLACLSSTE